MISSTQEQTRVRLEEQGLAASHLQVALNQALEDCHQLRERAEEAEQREEATKALAQQ